jgi:hypothetical protein
MLAMMLLGDMLAMMLVGDMLAMMLETRGSLLKGFRSNGYP